MENKVLGIVDARCNHEVYSNHAVHKLSKNLRATSTFMTAESNIKQVPY